MVLKRRRRSSERTLRRAVDPGVDADVEHAIDVDK